MTKNPGKYVRHKTSKKLGIAYNSDNTEQLIKQRMGRIVFKLIDEDMNLIKKDDKYQVSIAKASELQVIGFVD